MAALHAELRFKRPLRWVLGNELLRFAMAAGAKFVEKSPIAVAVPCNLPKFTT
jgi:post-segregation antitoxin (ccd killing protein)